MFNLVEFIKMDGDLKEELKQYENAFEKTEIVKLWKYKTEIVSTSSISLKIL